MHLAYVYIDVVNIGRAEKQQDLGGNSKLVYVRKAEKQRNLGLKDRVMNIKVGREAMPLSFHNFGIE